MPDVTVKFKKLDHIGHLKLPSYESDLAAGADIRAALGAGQTLTLAPGERRLVRQDLQWRSLPGLKLKFAHGPALPTSTALHV